jgi:erythromycin esterase-like protein
MVAELAELRAGLAAEIESTGRSAEHESLPVEQDALLALESERDHRAILLDRASVWNQQNRHLDAMLAMLLDHLEQSFGRSKVVVWAHNARVGDARATELADRGDLSLGQLVRQRFRQEAVLIGLTTYQGTVRAASDWGGRPELRVLGPTLSGSYESLFHEIGEPRFLLLLQGCSAVAEAMRRPRLERAIGTIYRPETAGLNHYILVRLSDQFDAVVHFDQTTAVHPLIGDPSYELEDVTTAPQPGASTP